MPPSQSLKRAAQVMLGPCPIHRHSLPRPFKQGLPKDGHRLLQSGRSALTLSQYPKSVAQVVLGHRPTQRRPLPCTFLQSPAKDTHRFLQSGRSARPCAMWKPGHPRPERVACLLLRTLQRNRRVRVSSGPRQDIAELRGPPDRERQVAPSCSGIVGRSGQASRPAAPSAPPPPGASSETRRPLRG